jgi:DNA-binding SARP family transcriptional activator/class 3 adenylate cyclase
MHGEMISAVATPPVEPAVSPLVIEASLLGLFSVATAGRVTGPWPRPSARRICQLVLVSPGRRVSRETACQALFPAYAPKAATKALYKALSMARAVLGELAPQAAELLTSDHNHIWAGPGIALEVDLDAHERALRAALAASPGERRDLLLVEALRSPAVPLDDEHEAEWAERVRQRIQYLRQEARLELARDRSAGRGRGRPEETLQAWEACLDADSSCDEAASALIRLHAAQGRRQLALAAYERCSAAYAELGLPAPASLGEAYAGAIGPIGHASSEPTPRPAPIGGRPAEERRLVTVVAVGLTPGLPPSSGDPEDLRELVAGGLARAISEAESLGGSVASVSSTGMSVLFGAPRSHEDDPERALRAALRIVAALGRRRVVTGPASSGAGGGAACSSGSALSVRVGVETGMAVVGPIGGGGRIDYGAVGAVVGAAEALRSAAAPDSVLVGRATRAATEGIFEWGETREVLLAPDLTVLASSHLVGARAHPSAEAGRRQLAAAATLVGRDPELAVLGEAVRATVSGTGGAVVLVGEPGLGKSRLVAECRKYFMGWVGAASGRLPLWLEGRCASYASSTPYGAYQQLLVRFIGAPLEAGESVLRAAFEAATRAVLGGDRGPVPLLARLVGLDPGPAGAHLARMDPPELQQATFAAMRTLLTRLVERGPTVLAIEDLHWSDPTSLRLTADLARLAAEAPLLVLATRRPEPDPGVGELESELSADPALSFQRLELAPLEKSAERALARSLLGGEADKEVLEMVCDGADGNPLFLEERLASLLDSGALARAEGGWRIGQGDSTPLPEALERLIRARFAQ